MIYKMYKVLVFLSIILMSNSALAEIDFNSYTIMSYGGSQDVTGTAVVEDAGAALHLTGNVWKCIQYPYNVTSATVLEFDFQSDIQGEEHCIGMDADLGIQQDNRFKLYGTQATGTYLVDFNDYASYAPNTRHYVIPIGQYYTGQMQYLFFVNDHDVASPMGESVYSNVLIHESGEFPPQPASTPQPAHGTPEVSIYPDLTLSWVAGSGSDSHNVYFGTNASPAISEYMGNQPGNTFSPQSLAWNTTYFWRIDEVNEHGVTAGPVWSFTTSDSENIVIDDFEAYYGNSRYADVPISGFDLLTQKWKDGSTNGSGSEILNIQEGCLEFFFDNSSLPYRSEVERTFASPIDLATAANFKYLSLWFKGSPDASGLYLRLYDNGGIDEIVHITNTEIFQTTYWREVLFDLGQFSNIDLTAITKIVIGIADEIPSASTETATVCIDDIRLYQCRILPEFQSAADLNGDCEIDFSDIVMLANYWLTSGYYVNAVAPDNNHLVAYYEMNDGAGSTISDSSGNACHGTLITTAETTTVWAAAGGYEGGCLVFDGTFSVQLPSSVFSSVTGDLSISVWLYSDQQGGPCDIDPAEFGVNSSTWQSLLWENRDSNPADYVDTWNHFAFVKDSAQSLLRIYKNGFLVSQATVSSDPIQATGVSVVGSDANGEEYYSGKMDDMRVYDYALSQEEILHLISGGEGNIYQSAKPVFVPFDPYEDGRIDLSDFAVIVDELTSLDQ